MLTGSKMEDDKKLLDKTMDELKNGMTARKALKGVFKGMTALLVIFIIFLLVMFVMFS